MVLLASLMPSLARMYFELRRPAASLYYTAYPVIAGTYHVSNRECDRFLVEVWHNLEFGVFCCGTLYFFMLKFSMGE
jgi:hypothetical protein